MACAVQPAACAACPRSAEHDARCPSTSEGPACSQPRSTSHSQSAALHSASLTFPHASAQHPRMALQGPGGRLPRWSGVAVMQADQRASSTRGPYAVSGPRVGHSVQRWGGGQGVGRQRGGEDAQGAREHAAGSIAADGPRPRVRPLRPPRQISCGRSLGLPPRGRQQRLLLATPAQQAAQVLPAWCAGDARLCVPHLAAAGRIARAWGRQQVAEQLHGRGAHGAASSTTSGGTWWCDGTSASSRLARLLLRLNTSGSHALRSSL